MINFSIDKIFKLDLCGKENLIPNCITFDNKFFYILESDSRNLYIFDKSFKFIKIVETKRIYSAITYSRTNNCFYATDNIGKRLYNLDTSFGEVDFININNIICKFGACSGLFCFEQEVFLTFYHCIISIDKCGNYKIKDSMDTCIKYSTFIKCSKYFLCSYRKHKHNIIYVYSLDNSETFFTTITSKYYIINIVFYCSKSNNEDIIFILTLNEDCEICILQCTLKYECLYIEFCEVLNKPLFFNYDYEKTYIGINNLIESVALMECAISRILNAEGKKIEKVVDTSNDICDLLEVNKSVNTVLNTVLHLEQIMVQKLESVKEISCNIDKEIKNN